VCVCASSARPWSATIKTGGSSLSCARADYPYKVSHAPHGHQHSNLTTRRHALSIATTSTSSGITTHGLERAIHCKTTGLSNLLVDLRSWLMTASYPAVEGSTETQILASRPSSRWSARRQLRPPRHPPCRRPAWPRGHSDAQTRCRSSITRRLFARGARRAALAPLMHPPSTHATQFHSVPAGGHRWLAGARTRDQRRGAPFSHHQLAPPPPSSLVSAI
jgi:hypothetical protein